jgi:Na+-translocating ferredoxin:NAD+ oxidoreductase subunit B
MLKTHHFKFHIKRREFLKTTALAGVAVALPGINVIEQDTEVINGWYERLAESLNKLPNSFPRTKSNIEIKLLKKIFLPEEANLAGQLTGSYESVEVIAKRTGLPMEETAQRMKGLLERSFAWGDDNAGVYRLSPFIVGIYESQLPRMDHELAHLVEEYFHQGGAEIMKPRPAIHRVIPAQSAVKSEWILPYDKLRELLISCNTFRVNNCICRVQQDLEGTRKCTFPLNVELIFYKGKDSSDPPVAPYITKEEALSVLDKTEKIGLVHTVRNVAQGIFYVCNCCGCCCGILRGINDFGIEKSVAAANYFSVIDPEKCIGCGTCISRCQMHAITTENDISIVNRMKCIGCGLCVTGCESKVARLELKPEDQRIEPPKDYETWEHDRLVNRGLSAMLK